MRREWPDDIKIAVNLSPLQFGKGNIVETITRVLSETGLAARRLELEITETVLLRVDDVNNTRNCISSGTWEYRSFSTISAPAIRR